MWERREPCHLRQRPTGFAHAAWGFEESSIHSEALPSRLALSLGMVPLSSRLCWPQALALAVPRTHGLGPDCSSCGSSFQMGRGGASGVRECVPASVSTQQWLPGDLKVVKGQQGKGLRKGIERSKIRAGGQRRQWGKEAGRPIRPSPPHQVIPEGHQGANIPTNPQNSGPSGQLGPVLAFVLGAEGVERGHSQNILNFFLYQIFKNGKDSTQTLGFISLKKKKSKIWKYWVRLPLLQESAKAELSE